MILLSARKLNSRFNMMTINEVSLNRPKLFPIFSVIFLFFKSKLFPIAVRFSAEILLGSWNSSSLPDNFWVIRTSVAFSLLGYVSDASNLSVLQSRQSEYLLPKFTPRTKHVLEGFSKSSFILRFSVCQEVLVISQIVIAFHRNKRLMSLLFYSTYSSFCNSACLLSMKCSCSMLP